MKITVNSLTVKKELDNDKLSEEHPPCNNLMVADLEIIMD
jgi:hypothetical protein